MRHPSRGLQFTRADGFGANDGRDKAMAKSSDTLATARDIVERLERYPTLRTHSSWDRVEALGNSAFLAVELAIALLEQAETYYAKAPDRGDIGDDDLALNVQDMGHFRRALGIAMKDHVEIATRHCSNLSARLQLNLTRAKTNKPLL